MLLLRPTSRITLILLAHYVMLINGEDLIEDMGSVYYYSTPADWTTAQNNCAMYGGHLITGSTRFPFNMNTCENYLRNDASNTGTHLWVGLSRFDDRSEWQWASYTVHPYCTNCAYQGQVSWYTPKGNENEYNCAHMELLTDTGEYNNDYQIRNVENDCDVELPYCCGELKVQGMPGLPDFTEYPTPQPVKMVTPKPTLKPSSDPTRNPTLNPTKYPTLKPTVVPTKSPTDQPSTPPTRAPSNNPSTTPTRAPTTNPTTFAPTKNGDTRAPTNNPTTRPTKMPSVSPTEIPTGSPTTKTPSVSPTRQPTGMPSITPSGSPSAQPSVSPSTAPTELAVSSTMDGDMDPFGAGPGKNRFTEDRLDVMAAIPIEGGAVFIIFLLFMASIRHFNVFQARNKRDDRFKIVSSISVPVLMTYVCNITAIIGLMMICMIIQDAETWDRAAYEKALGPYYVAFVSYSVGKFCLEIFFLNRLRNAFGATTFRISGLMSGVLYAWIFIIPSFGCYLFAVDEDASIFGAVHSLFIVVYSVMETILVLVLLFLFVKRLSKLVLQQKTDKQRTIELSSAPSSKKPTSSRWESTKKEQSVQSTTGSLARPTARSVTTLSQAQSPSGASSPDSGGPAEVDMYDVFNKSNKEKSWKSKTSSKREYTASDVKSVKGTLSEDQTKFIFLITRCILLNTIALITTNVFGFYFFWYLGHDDTTPIWVFYSLWTMDMFINCACLYLNFKFSDGAYNTYCSVCHGGCQSLMEYCTAKRIIEDNLRQVVDSESPQKSV
eukprot:457365_1